MNPKAGEDLAIVTDWLVGPVLDPAQDLWLELHAALLEYGDDDAVSDPTTGESLSGMGLLARVEFASAELSARGARAQDRVVLDLPRSVDEVVVVLACVRQAVAYVPMDRQQPVSAFTSVLDDCTPALVVSDRVTEWSASRCGVPGVHPSSLRENGAVAAGATAAQDADLAYICYTSGTTGGPKGVEIPRAGIDRLIRGATYLRVSRGDRVLRLAPLTFDASTFELFATIWAGGEIVVGPATPLDMVELADFLKQQRVDACWLTAGLFHAMAELDPTAFCGMRQVLTGGDRVSLDAMRSLHASCPQLSIVNGYGPTEVTTFCTVWEYRDDVSGFSPPIGHPVAGLCVATSQQGELVVAGPGLARGYRNLPELTRERFVIADGRRAYRTGDQVELSEDGILFAGRMDRQLKIRGFRVEPAAVDHILETEGLVSRSWTFGSDAGSPGQTLLCAYTCDADDVSADALLDSLARRGLPPHNRPQRFRRFGQLPLTRNGKIDEWELCRLMCGSDNDDHDPAEEVGAGVRASVRGLWQVALKHPNFDDTVPFFDAGGDSLSVAKLHAGLVAAFPHAEVTIGDLFGAPTVDSQVDLIDSRTGSSE